MPSKPFKRAARRTALPKMNDRRPLGRSGLDVSPFCLGRVVDPMTVPAAFDAGVNFFFITADMHWPVYEASRRGLELLLERGGGVRDRIVVGVVSYVTQPVFCHAPFREVIEAVKGLERIDLTIIGGAYAGEFMVRLAEYAYHRGENGSVPGARAVGASFHDRVAAAYAARHALVDVAFSRYNPVHPGAEQDLFPHLDPASPTLLYNFLNTEGFIRDKRYEELALSESHWRPKVTDYYRFALTRPEVDGLLCAPNHPRHVQALADALEEGPLTDEETTYMRDLADLDKGEATLA
jgi:aryl-alcohol dehydrogenase-like predicted oxidoreductase